MFIPFLLIAFGASAALASGSTAFDPRAYAKQIAHCKVDGGNGSEIRIRMLPFRAWRTRGITN